MGFEHLRVDYAGQPLLEKDAHAHPIEQFKKWFAQVEACEIPLANGMTLATSTKEGRPSARVVLMKDISISDGITFVTHYQSRKGQELADNPQGALVFWWPELHRQVRFEGVIKKASVEISDEYFSKRPRESNLSAMASSQSAPLESRFQLEERVSNIREKWKDKELERPASWGAYCFEPHYAEFWQGRPDRSHDRLVYNQVEGSWAIMRLFP